MLGFFLMLFIYLESGGMVMRKEERENPMQIPCSLQSLMVQGLIPQSQIHNLMCDQKSDA